jgi:hypothetical protein
LDICCCSFAKDKAKDFIFQNGPPLPFRPTLRSWPALAPRSRPRISDRAQTPAAAWRLYAGWVASGRPRRGLGSPSSRPKQCPFLHSFPLHILKSRAGARAAENHRALHRCRHTLAVAPFPNPFQPQLRLNALSIIGSLAATLAVGKSPNGRLLRHRRHGYRSAHAQSELLRFPFPSFLPFLCLP